MDSLDKKEIDVEFIAEKALNDKKILTELLEGILFKKDTIRFNSHKFLLLISEITLKNCILNGITSQTY